MIYFGRQTILMRAIAKRRVCFSTFFSVSSRKLAMRRLLKSSETNSQEFCISVPLHAQKEYRTEREVVCRIFVLSFCRRGCDNGRSSDRNEKVSRKRLRTAVKRKDHYSSVSADSPRLYFSREAFAARQKNQPASICICIHSKTSRKRVIEIFRKEYRKIGNVQPLIDFHMYQALIHTQGHKNTAT